jgi:hypothetical protein
LKRKNANARYTHVVGHRFNKHMDKVELTTDEKEELNRTVQQAKAFRNKKLKELTLITIGAMTLGLGASYWTGKLSWTIFLIGLTLGLLMLLVFLFAWYLAGRPINKMEKDLELGITRTAISEIKTINVFNRTIRLADGTTVYEGDSFYGKWTHGDKIFYRTTNSGEHLFICKKVE